jgi:hypothetical protein
MSIQSNHPQQQDQPGDTGLSNSHFSIRVGTPDNLWGSGERNRPGDPVSSVPANAFCVLFPDPATGRQEVLTAIFTMNLLGYEEIALLLADPNQSISRAIDFTGLARLRAGLRSRLVVITWSPRLAFLAACHTFPVYRTTREYTSTFSNWCLTPHPSPAANGLRPILAAAWRYAQAAFGTPEQRGKEKTSLRHGVGDSDAR